MTIEPDTKDWTWVIERVCPECGFDAAAVGRDEVGPAILANAAGWQEVLTGLVDDRPAPTVWSPLEYACHVRDVLRLYDLRLSTELSEAAATIAGRFASLSAEQWTRTGRRSDGASFTVDTFARYFLHDVQP